MEEFGRTTRSTGGSGPSGTRLIRTYTTCVFETVDLRVSVQTIQKSRVHSQKPDKFYEIIEHLYDGPYLELFARRPRAGWTSFGNDPALSNVA